MTLSIAMGTYNGATHLQAQLDSFAAQTRLPDELVISDDCSTDQTCALVQAFAATAPFPVRITVNPVNLGFARNFGRAMAMATGELVFLSDQDDVWLPEKLGRMEAEMQARPDRACLLNDAYLADGALTRNGRTKLGQIRAVGLSDRHFVMGCCAVVRRDLLALALPIPEQAPSHDNWLISLADELGLCARLDLPLQDYRLHGGNVSDFFVNRAGPAENLVVVRLGRLCRRFTSRGNFDKQARLLSGFVDRLSDRPAAAAALAGPAVAATALRRLEAELALLRARLRIRALPRHRRPGAIHALWKQGGYRQAGRLPGALKDLLLPMAPDPGAP